MSWRFRARRRLSALTFGKVEETMDSSGQSEHVYRMGWGLRVFGIVFMAMSAFFLIAFWGGAISGDRPATFFEMLMLIAFITVGVLLIVSSFRDYIALSQTEISLRTIVNKRTLPFDKIRGRRRYLDKGGYQSPSIWYLRLEPNDDRFPIVEFQEKYYKLDDFFYAWFNALPDLDRMDKEREEKGMHTSNFGLV
jgi:hypothetical protein